jgi:hypothetical protein
MRNDIEHQHQVALFRWAAYNSKKHPALDAMFAIPNGGARHIRVAQKLKAEGVKRGVPDVFVPWAKQLPSSKLGLTMYHGLFIEMKAPKGKPTKEQLDYSVFLTGSHYLVEFCYSWEEAARKICDYLEINHSECGLK